MQNGRTPTDKAKIIPKFYGGKLVYFILKCTPTLMYGSEAWVPTQGDISWIQLILHRT